MIIALPCVAQFVIVLDVTIVAIALPAMQADLGLSTTTLGWVLTAYTLVFGGCLVAAGRLADRVVVMYAGRKAEEAPVHELFAHPQHPYTIGLLGAVPRAGAARNGRLQEIPGRVPSLAELPGHCAFADRCPRADEQSWSEVPELREVRQDHAVACFHPGER
jgi:peptide/nickel transport system ATP-binding protein